MLKEKFCIWETTNPSIITKEVVREEEEVDNNHQTRIPKEMQPIAQSKNAKLPANQN